MAQYNLNATKPVEVWLSFDAYKETIYHPDGEPDFLPFQMQSIANHSNFIYPGTVTTILVPYSHFHIHREMLKTTNVSLVSTNYQFGVVIFTQSCSLEGYLENLALRQPDIVLLSLPTITKAISNTELLQLVTNSQKSCEKYVAFKNHVKIGYIFSVSDTYDYSRANISRQFKVFKHIYDIFKDRSVSIVISQAFDTPYRSKITEKTNGWWRLFDTSEYTNASCYSFIDKYTISKDFDSEENLIDNEWLQKPPPIERAYTGVIYSLLTSTALQKTSELVSIVSNISERYSKVVMIVDDDTILRFPITVEEGKSLAVIRKQVDITLLLLDHVDITRHKVAKPIQDLGKKFGIPGDIFSTYASMYVGNQSQAVKNFVVKRVLARTNSSSYKVGFSFSVTTCTAYSEYSEQDKQMITQTMLDETVQEIYFHFEEDAESVKLGANRLFQQRIAVLQECKRFAVRQTTPRITSVRFGFLMLHYQVDTDFYKNPWRIYDFAKYWELLTKWAGKTKTLVILNSAIDSSRILKRGVKEKGVIRGTIKEVQEMEIGWWRFQPSLASAGMPWIDKKTEALQTFRERQAKEVKMDGTNTVAILVAGLVPAVFLSFGIIVLLVRHYRRPFLTKRELDDFCDGNNDETLYNLPYDKTRYEISSGSFSIDKENNLGAGEFGMVCKGKLDTDTGKIEVAIKMMNQIKGHKSALTGLLSEIKVLAYLGKHENIVELLGANTQSLRQGKIFVFLELCKTGSLEKYLRRIRPQDTDLELEEIFPASKFGNKYVNVRVGSSSEQACLLDEALANDMYRWSREICSGMAFLATRHVVHADLATRNVLLDLKLQAKICDFGLSRRMNNYASYVKQKQEPLPWKWMSPEALKLLEFNEKSDVWSYGITLWEIYSLGEQPYPGLSWDVNFADLLEGGLQMGVPKYNERNMYGFS